MRENRKLVAIVAIVACLSGALPAAAGPGEVAALARILAVLREARQVLTDINEVVSATQETLARVYPQQTIDEIKHVFQAANGIVNEVTDLSCGWRFRPSTQAIWDGAFRGSRVCKPTWQDAFGAPVGLDADIQELWDANAALATNLVAAHMEGAKDQGMFWEYLYWDAKRMRALDHPQSAGYAQRLTAVGTAALGTLMVEQGNLTAMDLQITQLRASREMRKKRLELEGARRVIAGIASLDRPASQDHAAVREVLR